MNPHPTERLPDELLEWFDLRDPCQDCYEAIWEWCFAANLEEAEKARTFLMIERCGEEADSIQRPLKKRELNLVHLRSPTHGSKFRVLFPDPIGQARVRHAKSLCPSCGQQWLFTEDTFHGTPPMLTAVGQQNRDAADAETPLSKFIDSERSEGDYLSTGEFQLDWERAIKKRRQYNFEHPHQWLIRLLQLLVKLECKSLDVKFGRLGLLLKASIRGSFSNPESLLKPKDELGRIFLDACWGGCARELSVDVAWRSPYGKTLALSLSGDQVDLKDLGHRKGKDHFTLRVRTRSLMQRFAGLFSRGNFIGEYKALVDACAVLPFRVRIDSRLCRPAEPQTGEFPRSFALWRKSRSSYRGFEIPKYANVDARAPNRQAIWSGQRADFLILMRYSRVPRQAKFYWIVSGVPVPVPKTLLSSANMLSCCHTDIYISAEGLKTDLFGLKPVEGEPRTKEIVRSALAILSNKPPICFVEQYCKVESKLDTVSCLEKVFNQVKNLLREPVWLGDTSANQRTANLEAHELELARRVREWGGHRPPKDFWENEFS